MLDDTVERVNISLPRRVLRRLDTRARTAGETRRDKFGLDCPDGRRRAWAFSERITVLSHVQAIG